MNFVALLSYKFYFIPLDCIQVTSLWPCWILYSTHKFLIGFNHSSNHGADMLLSALGASIHLIYITVLS